MVRLHFLGCALTVGKSEGTKTRPRSFYLEMYDLIKLACGFECLLLMEGFHAEKIQAPGLLNPLSARNQRKSKD